MSMFAGRIADADEFRHPAGAAPAYDESASYTFACARSGVVGRLRVGLRADQRAGQATALVFLPTGETLFAYERVPDPGGDALAAGPITFEIIAPHEEQWLTFDGRVSVLADGRALPHPEAALAAAPAERTVMHLSVTGLGAPFGRAGARSLGHYEQFVRVAGEIQVDGRTFVVGGRGLRAHSWGPRDRPGPLLRRRVTAAMDDGSVLTALRVTRRDGTTTRDAAVCAGGEVREAGLRGPATEWTDDGFCRSVRCEVTCGAGTRAYVATAARPGQFVPLRHRAAGPGGTGPPTRAGYGPYTFTCSDGRTGLGLVEVMDRLADARPC